MAEFQNELKDLWDIKCPNCNSEILNKNGKYRGRQRFICLDCGKSFTTFSNTLFDSTKLSYDKWVVIITGILNNRKLSEISDKVNVSTISLSKIRIELLKLLYPLNKFHKTINKYYYDPFDTSSIFMDHKKDGVVYSYHYNDKTIIVLIQVNEFEYALCTMPKLEYNKLLIDVNYNDIEFIPFKECDDNKIILYFEQLISYLKSYRGIKAEYMKYYVNFYNLLKTHGTNQLGIIIQEQLGNPYKEKGTY